MAGFPSLPAHPSSWGCAVHCLLDIVHNPFHRANYVIQSCQFFLISSGPQSHVQLYQWIYLSTVDPYLKVFGPPTLLILKRDTQRIFPTDRLPAGCGDYWPTSQGMLTRARMSLWKAKVTDKTGPIMPLIVLPLLLPAIVIATIVTTLISSSLHDIIYRQNSKL